MKQYVEVIAKFGLDGEVYPKYLVFKNKTYPIDTILNVRPSSLDKGVALLYECLIKGQTRHLFFDRERWFVRYR